MKIEIGRLWLHTDGICYYGKEGLRIICPFPIQIGSHSIQGVQYDENEEVRLEIGKERKKYYGIAYNDAKLGMVAKFEIPCVHAVYIILEVISRKFKASTVEEEDLRKFLCRNMSR